MIHFYIKFKLKNYDEEIKCDYTTLNLPKEKRHWGGYAKIMEEDDNLEFMEFKAVVIE